MIGFSVDHSRRSVTVVARGRLSVGGLLLCVRVQQSMDVTDYLTLIEGTDYELELTSAEVGILVQKFRTAVATAPFGPIAVVAPSPSTYHLVRLLEILMADVCEMRPFSDRAAALAWLTASAVSPSF